MQGVKRDGGVIILPVLHVMHHYNDCSDSLEGASVAAVEACLMVAAKARLF